MKHLSYLNTLKFKFTASRLEDLLSICLFIAYLINFALLYYYNRELNNNKTNVNILFFLINDLALYRF